MMKKSFFWLFVPLLMLFSISVQGQCPTTATLSTTTVANTCAGNGSITATFNPSGSDSDVTIQLLKSGSVLQSKVNVASPFTFSNLQPGTDYEIRLVCTTDNSKILTTQNVSVEDKYIPISTADITAQAVCGNFKEEGKITINGITGGTAPYQYKVVQSTDPAFPETTGTYSTTTSYNVGYGAFQIRVMDACGNFKTFTKTISSPLNPVRLYWQSHKVCGSSTEVTGTAWYLIDPTTEGNASTNLYKDLGIKMHIVDANTKTVLFDGTVKDGDNDGFLDPFNYTKASNGHYIITTTNACGATSTYEQWLVNTDAYAEKDWVNVSASTSGCGASEKMNITFDFDEQSFWAYPVTITLTNKTTGVKSTYTWDNQASYTISGLDIAEYDITVTDKCGGSYSTPVVPNPTNAGAPKLDHVQNVLWNCELGENTQTGSTQIFLYISGYIPDRPNAVVTITDGPSNKGVKGNYRDNTYWGWSNMIPGGTYTVSIVSCGITNTLTFTVPIGEGLVQSIDDLVATSVCQGGGDIVVKYSYNGSGGLEVVLTNKTTGTEYINTNGIFTNLPAGEYSAKLKINLCWWAPYFIEYPSTVTLTGTSSGPVISSFVGIICEDANGKALATGSAYLDLSGVAPYTLQYRPTGTETWTIIENATSKTKIDDLQANVTYDLMLTDGCGNSYNSSVTIKTMGNLNTSTTSHPCNGKIYTLQIPYYAGATYQWISPSGTVVSNNRIYTINNYDSSYNGTYVCKITWGNCVTRFVNVTINSNFCGQPISDACYKDAGTVSSILDTNHGITALGRAGANNGNWPMVRKGAHTVLEAKTKGFVVNRLTTSQKNALTPAVGMMVYDTDLDCLSIYDGSGWKCYRRPGCPD